MDMLATENRGDLRLQLLVLSVRAPPHPAFPFPPFFLLVATIAATFLTRTVQINLEILGLLLLDSDCLHKKEIRNSLTGIVQK